MPYFITDSAPGCSGWATIKEDGEVIGCHTTKQAAIDQMVAVSIAEDMEPGGERNEESDEYIIVDVDGTLLNGSQPIRRVIDFVNKLHQNYYIYIVTARMEDEEEATVRDLESAGVRYDDIEFKDDESMSTPEYKAEKAQEIQDEDGPVVLAIDNDPDNLAAFRDMGIPVLDPADIKEGQEPELRILPNNYRPASSADVPANHNCGNCGFYKNFYCKRWDALVAPSYYCNAWAPVGGLPNDNPGQTVQTGNISGEDAEYYEPGINIYRQLSFDVPEYVRAAARKGLDYYGQGLAGDGLVARTVREARDMAAGRISEDKVIRANAWGARHLVDLEAPQNSDPDNDNFPGAGAVAFYLWGINPLDPSPAMQWFERQAERIREEENRLGYFRTLSRLSRLFLDK